MSGSLASYVNPHESSFFVGHSPYKPRRENARKEPIAKFISTGKFRAFPRAFYAPLEIANEKCRRVIVHSPDLSSDLRKCIIRLNSRTEKRRVIAYNCMFKPQIFTLTNLSGVKPRQDLGQNGVEDMIQLT